MGESILKNSDLNDFRTGFEQPTLAGLIGRIRQGRIYRPGKEREAFVNVMAALGYSKGKGQYGKEVWQKAGVALEPGQMPPELQGGGFSSWGEALKAIRKGYGE